MKNVVLHMGLILSLSGIFGGFFGGLSAHATTNWTKSNRGMDLQVENRQGQVPDFKTVALLGPENAALFSFDPAVTTSQDLAALIDSAVPKDGELIAKANLAESDFALAREQVLHKLNQGLFQHFELSKSAARKASWTVFNENSKSDLVVHFHVTPFFSPVDFEVSRFVGEGFDVRYSCFAGYNVRLDFEVVGIEFTGNPALTRGAQGILGTNYTVLVEAPQRKILPTRINLKTDDQIAEFVQECKNQKPN